MPTTNIDDLLIGGKTDTQPSTPEKANDIPDEGAEPSIPEIEAQEETSQYGELNEQKESATEADSDAKADRELDEYGNVEEKSKLYTKEEVDARINEAIRDRLARIERNNQPNQPQVQQQTKQNFEYDEQSPDSWQQQLEAFVENTVTKLSQKQMQQAQAQKEQQLQSEFEDKFTRGMGKFKDYVEVVQGQPITDAMVKASRGISDPAAFFYAAAIRAPQDLQRIAQMPDQYAQMVEIGKLEERMRKSKTTTSAPKPLSRTQEDSPIQLKSEKPVTGDDLLAQADARKKALQARRQR